MDKTESGQQDVASQTRTLNEDLFVKADKANQNSSIQQKKSMLGQFEPVLSGMNFVEGKRDDTAVSKDEIKKVKQQIDNLQIQMTELTKASQFKFERIVKNMRSMEQIQSHHRQEIAIHYAELSGKMKERKLQENKIADLVDRHNQIVNTFESRLNQMKKSIHEREIKFMQVSAALEEAQREIERLKRS